MGLSWESLDFSKNHWIIMGFLENQGFLKTHDSWMRIMDLKRSAIYQHCRDIGESRREAVDEIMETLRATSDQCFFKAFEKLLKNEIFKIIAKQNAKNAF